MSTSKTNKLIKEACVETKEQIDNAILHKADQIELCSQLALGGFTPDDNLVQYALDHQLKVMMMVRNRPDYTSSWWNTMKLKKIIKRYAKTNVAGFVFGFLKKNMIDEKTIKQLLKVTNHKETIFHMAFDELDNPKQGIDTLVRLGITRILTKGGKQGPATNNLVQLKALATYADQRIQLIVGGSVTDHNYQEIAKATGIKCYHGRKLALGT